MTFDEYADAAWRTAPEAAKQAVEGRDWGWWLGVFALGVAGEAGELADLVKKHLGHGHESDTEALLKEAGDVLWYLAALHKHLGAFFSQTAEANIAKLRARYPDGFSSQRSQHREGLDGADE